MKDLIMPYLQAGYPALAVATVEPERGIAELSDWGARRIVRIAAVGGLRDTSGAVLDSQAGYPQAISLVASRPDEILVVEDLHHILRNPPIYRAILQALPRLKAIGSTIVLLAPAWSLPPELSREIPVLEMALPDRQELDSAVSEIAESTGSAPEPDVRAACLDACAGLTLSQAESAMALIYAIRRGWDPARIRQEKERLVRSSGYLEVFSPVDPSLVGGMEELKRYVREEVMPSRDDPLLRVRGILLVGVPGTGKSLAAKAIGSILQYPVLRCDMGALKAGIVGQSESQMRAALKLAEAVAPCVLFLDELEKAVGGYQSSAHTDSGVTLGMVGALLTWLQEHSSQVITIATCNDYGQLPAEMTRAGRFDERFFLDLPTDAEREEIAKVHLQRYGCQVDGLPVVIAGETVGWTGAEIEQMVKSAARRTGRQITRDSLIVCAREIKPISRVRADDIARLREWACDNLRRANSPEHQVRGRKVRHG